MKLLLRWLLLLGLAGTVLTPVAADQTRKIKYLEVETLNGQVFTPETGSLAVKCDGSTDDTTNLQAAFDLANGGTITLPKNSTCIISSGMDLTSFTDTTINGQNATIKFSSSEADDLSSNGSDTGNTDSLIRLHNASDIVIRDLNLHGNLSLRTPRVTESFNDCITLHTSTDILLENLKLEECMTDGLYIGGDDTGPSQRVTIRDSHITGNRRNNISIISGTDILIENNLIEKAGLSTAKGTNPRSAIDIEPDNPNDHQISRVRILNNDITANRGRYPINITGEVSIKDVIVAGNNIYDNENEDGPANGAAINCQYAATFVAPFCEFGGTCTPFHGVHLLNNNIRSNNYHGIRVVHDACDSIQGNLIQDQPEAAILTFYTRELLIANNVFDNNGKTGGGSGAVIVGDESSTFQGGFMSLHVTGNVFLNNEGYAIAGGVSSCTNTAEDSTAANDCNTPFDPANAIVTISNNTIIDTQGTATQEVFNLVSRVCDGGTAHGTSCATNALEDACEITGGGTCDQAQIYCFGNMVDNLEADLFNGCTNSVRPNRPNLDTKFGGPIGLTIGMRKPDHMGIRFATGDNAGAILWWDDSAPQWSTPTVTEDILEFSFDASNADGNDPWMTTDSIGTPEKLIFEGATEDAFETTVTAVDPTADNTITLPDSDGTVVITGSNYVFCEDYDNDGDQDEEDIEACIDLVCETGGGGVVELAEGTYILDQDQDGVGESYCVETHLDNPHVCIPDNCWLRGQGRSSTILQLKDNTGNSCKLGNAPFIALDGDYDTDAVGASGRISNARISDLTVQTDPANNNSGCETANNCGGYGVMFWEADDGIVENVECRQLNDACVHMVRPNNSVGRDLYGYHVGSFDEDGATITCQPPGQQSCFEMYTSAGYNAVDSGFENITVDGCGATGIMIKSANWEERNGPEGEDALCFNDAQEKICQIFQSHATVSPVVGEIVIEPYLVDDAATGTLTVWIENVNTAATPDEPNGTAVTNCTSSDFESRADGTAGVDVATLPYSGEPLRFGNENATPCTLTNNTIYAVCSTYSNAVAQPDMVCLQYDDQAPTNTYDDCTDCDATVDSDPSGTPSWTLQTDNDLNFGVGTGRHFRPYVRGANVKNVTGIDLAGGQCVVLRGATDANIGEVACYNAGGVDVGPQNRIFGGVIHDVTVDLTGGTTNTQAAGATVRMRGSGIVLNTWTISRTSQDASAPCIYFEDWTSGVVVDNFIMRDCGSNAVNFYKGTRDIKVRNSFILGTQNDAFWFQNDTDTDGVFGGQKGHEISGNTIIGVPWMGIAGETDSTVQVQDIAILDNKFYEIGKNAINFVASSPDYWQNIVIRGNHFRGWGRNNPGANEKWGVRIEQFSENIVVDSNIFESTGNANEDRGLYIRTNQTGGDNIFVTDNVCIGTFATGCIVGSLHDATDTVYMSGNHGSGLDDADYRASFDIRYDGTICWDDDLTDATEICATKLGNIGAAPGSTCVAGQIFIDTDETDDTNCTTTADNSLCLCTATNTWTALENN